MKRALEKWTLWLPPLLATLFFLVLSRVTYFRYENSDDFIIDANEPVEEIYYCIREAYEKINC